MKKILFTLLISSWCFSVCAGGPLGIDHMITKDEHGIWSPKVQRTLEWGSAAVVVGGALWEGKDSRLGMTLWKTMDSMLIADAAAQAGKLIFRRQRPSDGNNPNAWFNSNRDRSFPSGEVTHITAIVTPLIAEYAKDTPAVWALALLPLYDAAARLKSQAHWQTDVLAGMALGVTVGLNAGQRDSSWLVGALPGGVSVGFKHRF